MLIAATVGTFSLLQSLILSGNQDLSPPPVESPEKVAVCEGPQIIRGEWIMAPTAIPEGRAGNLTALQEQKLKELWAALFKLFGTYQASNSPSNPGGPTNGVSDPTSASSLNADKRRKSRFNLLGRKKDDSSPAEPNATEPGDFGSGNADDKYGQGEEYKAAVASISPQDIRQYFWAFTKQDDPDALLLRFLRARKWDVQKALAMLVSTINWRTKEYDVDEAIVRVGEMGNVLKAQDPAGSEESRNDGKDFIKQINQGKAFLHGIDREGRPLTYVRARLHKPGAMTARSQEQIVIYCIETCRLTLVPPVDTATIVFDLTDFSIANMVSHRISSPPDRTSC